MNGQSDKEWRNAIRSAPDYEPSEAFVEKTRNICIERLEKQEKRGQWSTISYQTIVVAALLLLVWGVSPSGKGTWWREQGPVQRVETAKVESPNQATTAPSPKQQTLPEKHAIAKEPQSPVSQKGLPVQSPPQKGDPVPAAEQQPTEVHQAVPATPEKESPGHSLPEDKQKSLDQLKARFPALQAYTRILADDDDDDSQAVKVTLLKPDQSDSAGVVTVIFDQEGAIRGLHVSKNRLGAQPAIPEEKARSEAAMMLRSILGPSENPDLFEIVSVWTEKSFDLQMNPTIRQYKVNFKASIDSASAYYATIVLDSEGTFLSYEKVKKPHTYDSWYKADFDKRVRPTEG